MPERGLRILNEENVRSKTNEAMRRMSIPYQLEVRELRDISNPAYSVRQLVLIDQAGRSVAARGCCGRGRPRSERFRTE
jgi:hypothetical protein